MTKRLSRIAVTGTVLATLLMATACARSPEKNANTKPPTEPLTISKEQAHANGAEFGHRLREAAVNDERVHLRVNGEPVSLGEYRAVRVAATYEAEQRGKSAPGPDEVRRQVVARAALRAEARRLGVYPTDRELEERIKSMRGSLGPGSDPWFDGLVQGLGITWDEFWTSHWLRQAQLNGIASEGVAAQLKPELHPQPGEKAPDAFHRWLTLLASVAIVEEVPVPAVTP